jgi:hypothetical protein
MTVFSLFSRADLIGEFDTLAAAERALDRQLRPILRRPTSLP